VINTMADEYPSDHTKQNLLVIITYSCISLFFILVFFVGYISVGSYFSNPFPDIRGAMVLLFLAGGALLITFAINPPFPSRYLVPLYLIAIIVGYFYQLALMWDAPLGAGLIRSLFYVLLLVGLVIIVLRGSTNLRYLLLFAGWLLCNIFSIMGDSAPDEVAMLYVLGVILPGFFALALYSYFKTANSLQRLASAITVGVVGLSVGLIMVMFLSIIVKYGDITLTRKASDLGYASILIFLAWPFIFWRFNSRLISWKIVVFTVITLAFVFSFSRAVFLLGILLAIITFLRPSMLLRKQVILVLLVGLVIVFTLFVTDEVSGFWLGRLNISSWANVLSFDPEKVKGLLSNEPRLAIWNFAITSFFESPLIGHGLGSFPTLISNETGGVWAFTGAHSLLLTVMVERGIISAIFVAGMLIYIWIKLIWLWRTEVGRTREFFLLAIAGFSCFLIEAHSSGCELMDSGTMIVDSTVSIFIMVYLCMILSWKTIREELTDFI